MTILLVAAVGLAVGLSIDAWMRRQARRASAEALRRMARRDAAG